MIAGLLLAVAAASDPCATPHTTVAAQVAAEMAADCAKAKEKAAKKAAKKTDGTDWYQNILFGPSIGYAHENAAFGATVGYELPEVKFLLQGFWNKRDGFDVPVGCYVGHVDSDSDFDIYATAVFKVGKK